VTENLRSVEQLIEPAVRSSVEALGLGRVDDGLVKLALRYAKAIDDHPDNAWAMRWLAPHLLECLTALGATPAARAAVRDAGTGVTGKAPAARVSGLAQLRAARGVS
jgi:hypothetical protein